MDNIEQLLNKENWIKYLELADEGGITNHGKAQDIVSKIEKSISITHCCKSDNEGFPDVYLQELSKVEWTLQTQVSLNEQLQVLRMFANKLGLYDASDFIKK